MSTTSIKDRLAVRGKTLAQASETDKGRFARALLYELRTTYAQP